MFNNQPLIKLNNSQHSNSNNKTNNKTMKIKSKITLALLALGLVSRASADNTVYLTGSTAFRSIAYNALSDNAGDAGAVFDAGSVTVTALFGSSTASKCSYMLFHGNISGTPTYIDCAWSGSEAGIASAANVTIQNTDRNGNAIALAGSPEQWLKADGTVTTSGPNSSSPTTGQLEASTHQTDLTQADTSQAVSLTPATTVAATQLKDYGTEGIVPFTFAKNYNTTPSSQWTHLTNINIAQAFVEFGAPQPTGFFTGNTNDDTETVYLVGRNKGSGTRANVLSYCGYGTTTSVQQFSVGGGVQPGDTTTGLVLQSEGNNGYESGGGVAGALNINGSSQQTDPFNAAHVGWIAIGYLGTSDALSLTGTTNQWLTESGVLESDGAVEEGQYSFWGHEHLYGRNGISGYQNTVGGKIFTAIQGQLTLTASGATPTAHSTGIALGYMNCTKNSDVAYPTHN